MQAAYTGPLMILLRYQWKKGQIFKVIDEKMHGGTWIHGQVIFGRYAGQYGLFPTTRCRIPSQVEYDDFVHAISNK